MTIALVVEYDDDFPRYSEEERQKEFDGSLMRFDEAYLRDVANESSDPQDFLDWVNDNLVYYFSEHGYHPDRAPVILDSALLVDDPLPEQVAS